MCLGRRVVDGLWSGVWVGTMRRGVRIWLAAMALVTRVGCGWIIVVFSRLVLRLTAVALVTDAVALLGRLLGLELRTIIFFLGRILAAVMAIISALTSRRRVPWLALLPLLAFVMVLRMISVVSTSIVMSAGMTLVMTHLTLKRHERRRVTTALLRSLGNKLRNTVHTPQIRLLLRLLVMGRNNAVTLSSRPASAVHRWRLLPVSATLRLCCLQWRGVWRGCGWRGCGWRGCGWRGSGWRGCGR